MLIVRILVLWIERGSHGSRDKVLILGGEGA